MRASVIAALCSNREAVPYRGGDHPTTCPRCEDAALAAQARGSARALVCHRCGGLFLDVEAARQVARKTVRPFVALADDAARSPPRPARRALVLACPVCGTAMERVHLPGAGCHVDVCAAHGVWFDRWELQSLARATALAKGDQLPGRPLLAALEAPTR
jgi:Zn-finger nucleic acid-binding protein